MAIRTPLLILATALLAAAVPAAASVFTQRNAFNNPSTKAATSARLAATDANGNTFSAWRPDGTGSEIWIAKYRAGDGALLWQQPVDAGAEVALVAFALDPSGNALVIGGYRDSGGDADWHLAKLAGSSGGVVWRRIYDSGQDDVATGMSVDAAGDITVEGTATSNSGLVTLKTIKCANATGRTVWERSEPLNASAATPSLNVQGLWWNAAESGWGVNLTQQGDVLFATWFTYDDQGQPLWLVMSGGQRLGDNSYSGALYRTTGPAFNATPFESAKVAASSVGNASFTFNDNSSGVFRYTVNGVSRAKTITRQVFSGPLPTCSIGAANSSLPNYQDLWWAPGGAESGWGLNVTHQGDVLFVTWFTYGPDGRGMWLVGSGLVKTGNGTYSGTLYRTVGPPFSSPSWDASRVGVAAAGNATLTFSSADNGSFSYTLDGITQSKAVTRQVFSTPKTVCR